MLMIVKGADKADGIEWPVSGRNAYEAVRRPEPASGDTLRFPSNRAQVEVVLGFRPGQDRIVIMVAAGSGRAERLLTTEEAGSAVVVDGEGRRIVLQGVRLAELVRGDIELGVCS